QRRLIAEFSRVELEAGEGDAVGGEVEAAEDGLVGGRVVVDEGVGDLGAELGRELVEDGRPGMGQERVGWGRGGSRGLLRGQVRAWEGEKVRKHGRTRTLVHAGRVRRRRNGRRAGGAIRRDAHKSRPLFCWGGGMFVSVFGTCVMGGGQVRK